MLPNTVPCRGCLKDKHATDFEPGRKRCRECVAARRRNRYASDPQPIRDRESARYSASDRQRKHGRMKAKNRIGLILSSVRNRCKKLAVEYDLDHHKSDLNEMLAVGRCALTGISFDMSAVRAWNSPSIDRIKPELGYVFGNVRFVLWAVNAALGNWGEDVFAEVASAFLEKRHESA